MRTFIPLWSKYNYSASPPCLIYVIRYHRAFFSGSKEGHCITYPRSWTFHFLVSYCCIAWLVALKIKQSFWSFLEKHSQPCLNAARNREVGNHDNVYVRSSATQYAPPNTSIHIHNCRLAVLFFYCKDDFPEVFLSWRDFLQAGEKLLTTGDPIYWQKSSNPTYW